MTAHQLNAYFLYCIRKLKNTEHQINSRMNAVKAYFTMVLNREEVFETIPRPRLPQKLPVALTKKDISQLFSVTENPKHLLLLRFCYGMGLRVSEIVNLKVKDIDTDRMQVLVEGAKGKKDRYVKLPVSVLDQILSYCSTYRPGIYLFEGHFGGQYTARSVQLVFKKAMEKAKIDKAVGVHGLRHSFASQLLEAGTDRIFIEKLLNNAKLRKSSE